MDYPQLGIYHVEHFSERASFKLSPTKKIWGSWKFQNLEKVYFITTFSETKTFVKSLWRLRKRKLFCRRKFKILPWKVGEDYCSRLIETFIFDFVCEKFVQPNEPKLSFWICPREVCDQLEISSTPNWNFWFFAHEKFVWSTKVFRQPNWIAKPSSVKKSLWRFRSRVKFFVTEFKLFFHFANNKFPHVNYFLNLER